MHIHRGTPAVQKMVEYAPSTGGLALWVQHRDVDELPPGCDQGLAAANDGATIYYTPSFETLSLPQQIGVVAHQVLHVALRHPQRYQTLCQVLGDVDHQLYNTCADAIVNSTLSHLGWLELPRSAVLLDGLLATALQLQQSAEAALLEWDLERLYRAVDDRRRGRGRRSEQARRRGASADQDRGEPQEGADREHQDGVRSSRVRWLGANTPQDLLPADGDERPEREAEQAREWRERLVRAHAGDGMHSMLRQLIADLPKVRTPWEHLLRTLLTRGLSRSPERSWSRPSRSYVANQGRTASGHRMPWEPGVTASRSVPRLVVMVDVSGSVEDDLMERFAREIEAISRALRARPLEPARHRLPGRRRHRLHAAAARGGAPCAGHRRVPDRSRRPGEAPAGLAPDLGRARRRRPPAATVRAQARARMTNGCVP